MQRATLETINTVAISTKNIEISYLRERSEKPCREQAADAEGQE